MTSTPEGSGMGRVTLRFSWAVSATPCDLRVPGLRAAFALLDQVFEAEQECRPFGAAVVHELVRLAPALVAEEHESLAVAPFKAEADLCAHPVLGRTRIAPHHQARIGVPFRISVGPIPR